jgi:hypothetical protein
MIDIMPGITDRATKNGQNHAKTGGIPETLDALSRPGGNLGNMGRFRGQKREK